jgi:hypothetical protein
MRWARHAACMGEKRNSYRVLVGISEGKRPSKNSCRWEDNYFVLCIYLFMFSVRILQKSACLSVYSIHRLVFLMEAHS